MVKLFCLRLKRFESETDTKSVDAEIIRTGILLPKIFVESFKSICCIKS